MDTCHGVTVIFPLALLAVGLDCRALLAMTAFLFCTFPLYSSLRGAERRGSPESFTKSTHTGHATHHL